MTRGRLPGGGGSSVVGKRETRLYEPEERLHSSSRGVKTGAFYLREREGAMKMKTFWVLAIWVLLICYLHLGFVVHLRFGQIFITWVYEDIMGLVKI
ncbi:hypothetical protein Hanom_Chr14g01254731 [Helianthus anomalus]